MAGIARRVLVILLISVSTGFVIFELVNYAIVHQKISLESWPETFMWLRHLSSLGLAGVIAHALPFMVVTAIVIGVEKMVSGSKK